MALKPLEQYHLSVKVDPMAMDEDIREAILRESPFLRKEVFMVNPRGMIAQQMYDQYVLGKWDDRDRLLLLLEDV